VRSPRLFRPPERAADPGLPLPTLLRESDGGRFLLGARPPDERSAAIEAEVEREGAWEERFEPRPGIEGLDRVERLGERRFSASCDHHGTFSVELASCATAAEAVCVLGAIQRTLVDAIEWGSWPDDRRNRARTPGERYIRRLAREARKAARLLAPEVKRALKTPDGWAAEEGTSSIRAVTIAGRKAFRVEVAEDSLVLATHAATLDRALAFLGLYTGLQRDLRRILGWEPLPAHNRHTSGTDT
jgi:hypothetical protein